MQYNVAQCEEQPILHSTTPQAFEKLFNKITAFESKEKRFKEQLRFF